MILPEDIAHAQSSEPFEDMDIVFECTGCEKKTYVRLGSDREDGPHDLECEHCGIVNEVHKKKRIEPFYVNDPFNDNVVTGLIHKTANTKYGQLEIETVNGKDCYQVIWTTPKMHYPMDHETGKFRPPPFNRIEIYEKFDGTNILGFNYHDADGKIYTSYKTRLMPFLKLTHKFGDFFGMWKEMLKKYPKIPDLIRENECNLSFELFGKRNKVMVEYDVSLDTVLLFGTKDGIIIPPTGLKNTDGVPTCQLINTIDKGMTNAEFEKAYQETVEYLNEKLRVEECDNPELFNEMIYGMEGTIWYLINDDGSVQEKCKPDHIRDLHWAASEGIPEHSIRTTIRNAFEQDVPVTYELVKEWLLEEFPESEIDRKSEKVRRLIHDMIAEKELKDRLFQDYLDNGFDIVKDKGACMRWFGQNYDRKHASKIYGYLIQAFGVE